MRYTGNFNGYGFVVFLIVLSAIFLILPKLRRSIERNKTSIFSCRAIVICGPWYFKKGGIFYRLTVYEDFFLIVFLQCQKINFRDIQNLTFEESGVMTMVVHGVQIKIVASSSKLKILHAKLQSRTNKQ